MSPKTVVLRRLRVDFRALCEGRELKSPDGRFVARAASTYAPRYVSESKSCYEFAVEDRSGARLQYFVMPVPRDDLINWRREGSISWADDSSSVTFEFQRVSLTLTVSRSGEDYMFSPCEVVSTDSTYRGRGRTAGPRR